MKGSARGSLLYDESQLPSSRGVQSSGGGRYPRVYRAVIGIIGICSLIAAVVLTIVGVVGLRDYGFSNGPLIGGIVLFGIGGAFTISFCVSSALK